MTERHLENLIQDTNGALDLLTSLSESFRIVEDQTTSFQAQCDDLLSEQKRLQTLADDVGSDLDYYAYLENVTRRLNAPGASRLVDDEAFPDVLANLDSCIAFMMKHVSTAMWFNRQHLITLAQLSGCGIISSQIPGVGYQSTPPSRSWLHFTTGNRFL